MGKKTTVEIAHSDADLRIQIGERCAMGADTMEPMRVRGIIDVAQRQLTAVREGHTV